MVFPCYVGVGKTHVASKDNNFIDLDSFYFKNSVADIWYEEYCKLAISLSEHGYNVFTSCHDEVLEYFSKHYNKVVVIYPDITLKDVWIKRLYDRYKNNKNDKNLIAYQRVCKHFCEDIENSFSFNLKTIYLKDNSDIEKICLECI